MIQQQIKTEPLKPCGCGDQPKLYYVRGPRTYFLECAPCRVQTARLRSLAAVRAAWGQGATVRAVLRAVG